MTDELKAAFINAQTAMMRAEMEGMLAENQYRMTCGNSPAYGEEAFIELRQRYEPILGYNSLITYIQA